MIYTILMYAVGFLVLLVAGIYGIGASLPVEHTSYLERVFPAQPGTIYAMIRDFKRYPAWRPNIKNVEEISSNSWKETDSHKEVMTFSFIQDQKDRLIESKIMDEDKPFGGSWTFELSEAEGGTKLKITENGKVFSPVFRFFSKFIFGHTATIDSYLDFMSTEIQRKTGK
ncbi:LIC10604 family protein [Leptospira sanjuanensis]|uniref:LIC10604 family protein n=1 Tax=Leptospira sanjuanensis TaxID=2879643 RepID=UPI001EE8CE94|nr:SRPBCC family protein [Leptospira sanjuanensis]MCG6169362.1 SRPBCC family protein [Leptospira sanjuanensis]